jgi:DNA repair exonuclease SbcCD nuclease subunit
MILVTADLHLNDLSRDAYRHDWMRNILPSLLRKYKAERLIILGDLTDSKDEHNAWLTNSIVDHLSAITKICPVVILMGNHDYVEADCPFFEFLGKIEGLTWIGIADGLRPGGLYLPHTPNYKRDWKGLDFKGFDYIFAHQTFQGAKVGPRKLDGIPTIIFPRNARVISGDIHVPQSFGPVTYVGAPYTIDFGDDFNPRVLLLDNVGVRSLPSPGPQKRLVEIPNSLEHARYSHLSKGDILKVRVTIRPDQVPKWASTKDEIRLWGERCGYNIHLIQPVVDSTKTRSMTKRKISSKSDEELLATYAGAKAVSEATLKTGLGLMKKV